MNFNDIVKMFKKKIGLFPFNLSGCDSQSCRWDLLGKEIAH